MPPSGLQWSKGQPERKTAIEGKDDVVGLQGSDLAQKQVTGGSRGVDYVVDRPSQRSTSSRVVWMRRQRGPPNRRHAGCQAVAFRRHPL